MPPGPSRTSDILIRLAAGRDTARISVREIVEALGERAYALLIVVLGLPNCLPMPPPIPLLCGLLLLFVAAQIVVGWPSPWLPKRLLDRTISHDDLVKAANRAVPWLQWLERGARPRLVAFSHALALRLIGCVLLVFSLALVFAAPVIGQIPLGLAVCLVGLGIVERDGYVVIAGLVVGAIGTSLSLGFLLAIFASATAIM
ncbi:MAG: exopolysaccharide biosynthesis protein [Alsobacter sp.]